MTTGLPFSFGIGTTFRPTFTSPGVPGQDYVVGRTSTNQLSLAIIATSNPIAALSSTSITIGNGAKVFTIDTNKSMFNATDIITLASTANTANFMTGTVTSLVGSTLTCNITSTGGSGTFSDWECILHLPANCSDAGNAIRTGSSSADFSITDWDYRGVNAAIYIQNTKKVTFSQCMFDLSGWTSGTANQPFIALRSGTTASYSVDHSYFGGLSSTIAGPTTCLGVGLVLAEYIQIDRWSGDMADIGPISGGSSTLRYSTLDCAATVGGGLHPDGMQLTSSTNGAIDVHHIIINVDTGTSCFNIGTNAGDITSPVTINNVWMRGAPSYKIYSENKSNLIASSTVTYGANVFADGGGNGYVYPATFVAGSCTGLSIAGLKSPTDGSALTFGVQGLVSQSSVTIGTGSKSFTKIAGSRLLTPTAAVTIYNPPTSPNAISNSMTGTVTSDDGTTLVINVASVLGSGTLSSWAVGFSNLTSYP